jgi:hypothetical protein
MGNVAMTTPLDIIAEIQMILAERTLSKGAVSDRECVDRISSLLERPDVVAVALDLQPRDGRDTEPRGGERR